MPRYLALLTYLISIGTIRKLMKSGNQKEPSYYMKTFDQQNRDCLQFDLVSIQCERTVQ